MPMMTNGVRKRPAPQQKPSTQQRNFTNHETGRPLPRSSAGNQSLLEELQKTLQEETSSSNQEKPLTSKMLESRQKPTVKPFQPNPTSRYERPRNSNGSGFVDDLSSTTNENYPDVTRQINQEILDAPLNYPEFTVVADQNYNDVPASIDEKSKAGLPNDNRRTRAKIQKTLKSNISKLEKVFPRNETNVAAIIHSQFESIVESIDKPESAQEMLYFIDWCIPFIEHQQLYSIQTLTKHQSNALDKVLPILRNLRGYIEAILGPKDQKQLFQAASPEKAKHNLLSAIQKYKGVCQTVERVFCNDGPRAELFYQKFLDSIKTNMQELEQQIIGHNFLQECKNQEEFYKRLLELHELVTQNIESVHKILKDTKYALPIEGSGTSVYSIALLLEGDPLQQLIDAFVDYQAALDEHFVMKTQINYPK